MKREAWAVVDLGFGDAGKGSLTDFLVRDRSAELVVRFNGGAQAGHNVITEDGRHHTFSQFCAGTFAGARGLLGPDFLLHPLGMSVEAAHLELVGVPEPWALTEVDRTARVITPFQQAAGRVREVLRGDARHGSCGVGIGECAADSLDHPEEILRAGDLSHEAKIRRILGIQRERKRAELRSLGAEDLSLFEDQGLIDRVVDAWREVASQLRLLDSDAVLSRIAEVPRVIFEGAQGVLLDETWGFHPHTTWSDCTLAGALALVGDRPVRRLGVTRAYGVRHGPGPFPTEGGVPSQEEHNADDGHQGHFRTGALDGVLLRYGIEACEVDNLAVTCLDHPRASVCDAYDSADRGIVRSLTAGDPSDLGHRQRLGAWLRTVKPVLSHREPVAFIEEVTGVSVCIRSRGPVASHKSWEGT